MRKEKRHINMTCKPLFLLLAILLTSCGIHPSPILTPTVPIPTGTATRTDTPLPPTPTDTPTLTFTPSPTVTAGPSLTPTLTPSPKPTKPTEGPGPGIIVRGYVRLADGTGVEGVNINIAFSAYPGRIVAVTNSNGYYQSDFIGIPGDETVRVSAEAPGYNFKPGKGSAVWTGSEFYWHHYFGFEEVSLDFLADQEPIVK